MMFKTFLVTEDHLKLLRRLEITYDDWTEFGAPIVDPKRPYGNSNPIVDIAEILGWMPNDWWDGDQEVPDEWDDKANKIHKEMETVLQILVLNLGIETGTYQTSSTYRNDWSKN